MLNMEESSENSGGGFGVFSEMKILKMILSPCDTPLTFDISSSVLWYYGCHKNIFLVTELQRASE